MRWQRGSGILLHPTSLPGPYGCGDIGAQAELLVGWLAEARQRYWQVLPLHPPGEGASPYSSLSAFACSPLMVDLADLVRRHWLRAEELPARALAAPRADFAAAEALRLPLLAKAYEGFRLQAGGDDRASLRDFSEQQAGWLDDYALFMALRERFGQRGWHEWPAPLAAREPGALEQARRELKDAVDRHRFIQWCFFRQWRALRALANGRGIKLVGDLPIFVAYDSADVWAHRELFRLDSHGRSESVSGVPPDYFSKTGQRWGNPLYRWDALAATQYRWWADRLRTVLQLVDVVRIDHFRGFEACWEIPAEARTAVEGRWVAGPGAPFFEAMERALGGLPIIAEDLGDITDAVHALRDRFALPGMKVLQFAFSNDARNGFLPHNYVPNMVVYTGTHDNDTSRGWLSTASRSERQFALGYLGTRGRTIHWDLMRLAAGSVADVCLFPMQDVLGLGSEGRMNRPGIATGNWDWRFDWQQLPADAAARLAEMSQLFGR